MNQYRNTLKLLETKFKRDPLSTPIALALRDTRLKQNKTLEFVSHSICTPSTLSKIELGLIHPNAKLLTRLLERLKLDSLQDYEQPPTTAWLDSLQSLLLQGHFIHLEHLYDKKSTPYYYQQILKQFIIDATLSRLDTLTSNFEYLLSFQTHMTPCECVLFYHYVGVYYLKLNNPKLAIKYYRLAFNLNHKMKLEENPLLSLNLAQYYFNLKNSVRGIYHLNDALKGFSSRYLVKYTIECELLLCEDYIKNHTYSKAKTLLSKLYHQLKLDDPYHYLGRLFCLIGDYHFQLKDYTEAENHYSQAFSSKTAASNPLLKLLNLYYQSGQTAKQLSLIKKMKSTPDLPDRIHIHLTYYDFLTHDSNSDAFRFFLLKEAIPLAIKQADFHHFELYSNALIDLYLRNGKYKLAFQIQSKLSQYQSTHLLS